MAEFTKKIYNKKRILSTALATCLILALLFALILKPQEYTKSAFDGLMLWATVVLPSVLPYFVLTGIFSKTGVSAAVSPLFDRPMQTLYRTGGETFHIYFMSLLCGNPVGASLIYGAHSHGKLKSDEAMRAAALTGLLSPALIFGTIAAGFFENAALGAVIYISAAAGALINGFIYRGSSKNKGVTSLSTNAFPQKNALSESISESVLTVLTVGGYITVFYILSQILSDIGVMNIFQRFFGLFFDDVAAAGIPYALLEITGGCKRLTGLAATPASASLLGFLTALGGVSIIMQSYSFIGKCGVKPAIYLLGRLTHALISAAIAYPLALLLL